jgi:hypothetical protein
MSTKKFSTSNRTTAAAPSREHRRITSERETFLSSKFAAGLFFAVDAATTTVDISSEQRNPQSASCLAVRINYR